MKQLLKMTRISAALALLALCSAGATAQQTKLLTADKHNEYGLVYTLPVTALRIEVTATRTLRKAGPYYQYAKRFVGTDKVVKADAEEWTIQSVKVTPFGVPDADNRYLMQLKSGQTSYICVDDNGMLRAINKEIPGSPLTRSASEDAPRLQAFSGKEYLQYVGEDFLASQSSAKQAQMLAESLMEVRDAKISLTRGTAESMPTDGKQLELMLKSLADQEATMTAAFVGTEQSETVTRTYTFTPDKAGKTVIFRMSDFCGFVDPDDYSGEPVYLTVADVRKGELPKDDKGKEKELPKDAVVYRVPGAASISLSHAGKTLWSGDVECAQYGILFGLAPSLFTAKKEPSYAVFNPATGALEEIGTAQ